VGLLVQIAYRQSRPSDRSVQPQPARADYAARKPAAHVILRRQIKPVVFTLLSTMKAHIDGSCTFANSVTATNSAAEINTIMIASCHSRRSGGNVDRNTHGSSTTSPDVPSMHRSEL
jgi:hypothetical protein